MLVVDDEQSHRRIACRMLERLGCTSMELEDGEDLMRALVLTTRKFDAVLLDIVMRHSNGLAVVADLRAHHIVELPVVAATAYHSAPEDADYIHAGFDAILDKPFTQRQLAQTLARVVFRAGAEAQEAPADAVPSGPAAAAAAAVVAAAAAEPTPAVGAAAATAAPAPKSTATASPPRGSSPRREV